MTGHVFISYSRTDRAYVDRLADRLRAAGLVVWYDQDLLPGESWEKVLQQRIEASSAIVVVMTPRAEASSMVLNEIDFARSRKKPFAPLLLEGECFFGLRYLQYENVTSGDVPSARFIDTLKALVQSGEPETPEAGDTSTEVREAYAAGLLGQTTSDEAQSDETPPTAAIQLLTYLAAGIKNLSDAEIATLTDGNARVALKAEGKPESRDDEHTALDESGAEVARLPYPAELSRWLSGRRQRQVVMLEDMWAEDGMTTRQISDQIRYDQANVYNTVRDLMKSGVVERVDSSGRPQRWRISSRFRNIANPTGEVVRWRDATNSQFGSLVRVRDVRPPFVAAGRDPMEAAEFRFGWRIACSALSPSTRAGATSAALLSFLGRPGPMAAISQLTSTEGLVWHRYGDHARVSFGAVLDVTGMVADPVAWAWLNPTPTEAISFFGREAGCTDLVVGVRPGPNPIALDRWDDVFARWLELGEDVSRLIAEGLGMVLLDGPPMRVGLAISAAKDLAEVVDISSAARVPGTTVSRSYFASGIRDETGLRSDELASVWSTSLRDDAMHVDE